MGCGGKGKGDGGWTQVWMPTFQKGGWSDKGRGKGHRGFTPDKKAWIGDLPDGVSYKELHEHMKPAGAKWVEVFEGKGKGTGVACFASPEEAAGAIAALNGSTLGGAVIQVDVWEGKPKSAEAAAP